MMPTIFGGIVIAIGAVLLAYGSILTMLCFVLCASMFGGSAALVLSAMGGSTIPPGNFALIFLVLRCMLAWLVHDPRLPEAFTANRVLIVFWLYSVLGALLLPRVFAHAIDVTPLRPELSFYLYAASPLQFSSQNVTVSVYMTGTLLAAICAYLAGTRPGAGPVIARLGSAIAAIHAVLGILSLPFGQTVFFTFFRNGFYAQVDQAIDGVGRINGIWAEPATYAAYGVIWFIFTAELWLRGVDRRWTGTGLLLITSALILSTSTTAYVGIGAYGVVLVGRQIVAQRTISITNMMWLMGAFLIAVALGLTVLIASPTITAHVDRVLTMTVANKLDSSSGLQRAFWAKQGIDAFLVSAGLGIGPGSFRSSSLLAAIMGSTGIIGTSAFLIYLAQAFCPLRRSTYRTQGDIRTQVGVAASWTSVMALLPAFLSAPSPDPGYVWGIFCGLALALRRQPAEAGQGVETPAPMRLGLAGGAR
jgi:hypothetical protein